MEEYIIKDRVRQVAVTAIIALAVMMYTLDYSMVNISIPTIARALGVKLAVVEWIPLVYMLIITSLLLGFGKLGDIVGYKKIFILGVGIFVAGTILCGISVDIKMLIVSRIIEALGEAILSPVAIAILTTFLPSGIRGRALGVVATAQGLGIAVGSMTGGLITTYIGWHAIFFVNVPIAIVVIISAIKFIPSKQARASDKRFDIIGAFLIFVMLLAVILALNAVLKSGLRDIFVMSCLVVSLASAAALVIYERRIAYPILDPGLFADKSFTFGNIAALLALLSYMGLGFLLPFYLELVKGMTVSRAGFFMMIPSGAMMVLAPVAGRLSDRFGSRPLCSIGMVVAIMGLVACIITTAVPGRILLGAAMFMFGCAMGIFLAPNNKLVMASAAANRQGVASGVYKTVLNAGSVFGVALMPLVLIKPIMLKFAGHGMEMSAIKQSPETLAWGFRNAFLFGVVLCFISLLFSVLAKDKAD